MLFGRTPRASRRPTRARGIHTPADRTKDPFRVTYAVFDAHHHMCTIVGVAQSIVANYQRYRIVGQCQYMWSCYTCAVVCRVLGRSRAFQKFIHTPHMDQAFSLSDQILPCFRMLRSFASRRVPRRTGHTARLRVPSLPRAAPDPRLYQQAVAQHVQLRTVLGQLVLRRFTQKTRRI